MKTLYALFVSAMLVMMVAATGCQPIQADYKQEEPMANAESNEMKGRSFDYQVADYHIQITFEEETQLRWEYLAAPDGLTGKTATETIERSDVRPDVILMRWTEEDGTQVIDVLDLGAMIMYANGVGPDGQRFMAEAELTEAGVEAATTPAAGAAVSLKGRVFDYQVADYHIQITFEEETQLRWEYLAAPDGLTGKTATEEIERSDVRPDVILMRWTEEDGTQVIDVLDLGAMIMYANGVGPDGQLFMAEAELTETEQ